MDSRSSIRQAHFLDSTRKLVEPISDNVVVEMEIEDDAIDALDFVRTPVRSACSSRTQSWRYDGTLHGVNAMIARYRNDGLWLTATLRLC